MTDHSDLVARLRHGEGQDWDMPYATREEAADHIETQAATIEALRAALVGEREQNLWWAYYTGHEKDGQWDHMCMSDGEWLVRQIGLDQRDRVYDAETIKAAIPKIAKHTATAIASGAYRETGSD